MGDMHVLGEARAQQGVGGPTEPPLPTPPPLALHKTNQLWLKMGNNSPGYWGQMTFRPTAPGESPGRDHRALPQTFFVLQQA